MPTIFLLYMRDMLFLMMFHLEMWSGILSHNVMISSAPVCDKCEVHSLGHFYLDSFLQDEWHESSKCIVL